MATDNSLPFKQNRTAQYIHQMYTFTWTFKSQKQSTWLLCLDRGKKPKPFTFIQTNQSGIMLAFLRRSSILAHHCSSIVYALGSCKRWTYVFPTGSCSPLSFLAKTIRARKLVPPRMICKGCSDVPQYCPFGPHSKHHSYNLMPCQNLKVTPGLKKARPTNS